MLTTNSFVPTEPRVVITILTLHNPYCVISCHFKSICFLVVHFLFLLIHLFNLIRAQEIYRYAARLQPPRPPISSYNLSIYVCVCMRFVNNSLGWDPIHNLLHPPTAQHNPPLLWAGFNSITGTPCFKTLTLHTCSVKPAHTYIYKEHNSALGE